MSAANRSALDRDMRDERMKECAGELLAHTKLLERSLVYEINKCKREGDDEGATAKCVTLQIVRATISKVEGK